MILRIYLIILQFAAVCWISAAEKPNILFIVSEDNGPEFGCYGYPVKTPHLDKLAKAGILFERAYVPQAGCSQSRAAFLTGRYPHLNGQVGLATWKYSTYQSCQDNIVKSLNNAGYRSGIVGKLHVNPETKFPYSWKKFPSANFGRKNFGNYITQTKEFISLNEKPFFLQVNVPDAHRPFIKQVAGLPKNPLSADDVKPLPYIGFDTPDIRQQTADYYNCIMRLDTQIGQILEALQKSGKADNTIVIYIGDHGADLIRGKRTSYEGGVRIPMIVSWPNKLTPHRSKKLVSTLDIFPTLLDITGATAEEKLSGRSLTPLFTSPDAKWRDHLFTQFHLHSDHNVYPQRTVCDSRYKLIYNVLHGVENPGYAFTLNRYFQGTQAAIDKSQVAGAYRLMKTPPKYELYDLKSDPHEFNNLADDPAHKTTLERLVSTLTQWQKDTKDPFLDPAVARRFFNDVKARKGRKPFDYASYMEPKAKN